MVGGTRMSFRERIGAAFRGTTGGQEELLGLKAVEARDKWFLVLHKIASPASKHPSKFEAQRIVDGVEAGVITILAREGSLGAGPSAKLLKFKCDFGRHVNPVILLDVRRIGRRSDEALTHSTSGLLADFSNLRTKESVGRGEHGRGFCRMERVRRFASNPAIMWV